MIVFAIGFGLVVHLRRTLHVVFRGKRCIASAGMVIGRAMCVICMKARAGKIIVFGAV